MGAMAGGWPVLQPNSKLLFPWIIPGADRKITLRNDYVGFNLTHFALSFNDLCERLNGIGKDPVDEGGYSYRKNANNAKAWSKHSAAVAVDLNWSQHPNGTPPLRTFTRAQVRWIENRVDWMNDLAKSADAVIWGGNFRITKDPMHWEAGGKIGDGVQRRLAHELAKTARGKAILKANPSRKALILS